MAKLCPIEHRAVAYPVCQECEDKPCKRVVSANQTPPAPQGEKKPKKSFHEER